MLSVNSGVGLPTMNFCTNKSNVALEQDGKMRTGVYFDIRIVGEVKV